MQGELLIMDRNGHTTVPWDTEVSDGPLAPAVAEEMFAEMVAGGAFAFATDASGTSEQIKSFDPSVQEKVTLTPAFAGG